jgi:hypothetical protein
LVLVATVGIWLGRRSDAPDDVRHSAPPVSQAAGPAASAPPAPAAAAQPSRDLSVDESRGGHTLARHVGLTDSALRERLARERGIGAASTYTDRATAEATVGRVLADQAQRVDAWTSRQGNRPNLALSYRGQARQIIGRTLPRGRRDPIPSTDAVVVLRWNGRGFFVLTSYPEIRR